MIAEDMKGEREGKLHAAKGRRSDSTQQFKKETECDLEPNVQSELQHHYQCAEY